METLLDAQGLNKAVPTFKPCNVIAEELSERDKDIEAVSNYLRDKSPRVSENQGGGQLRTAAVPCLRCVCVQGEGKTAFRRRWRLSTL